MSDIHIVSMRIDTENFTTKEILELVKLFEKEMELKCKIEYFDAYGRLVEVTA